MDEINKILWRELDELRSLKNVRQVDEDDVFLTVETSNSVFKVNKRDVIKIEYVKVRE